MRISWDERENVTALFPDRERRILVYLQPRLCSDCRQVDVPLRVSNHSLQCCYSPSSEHTLPSASLQKLS